MIEDSFKISAVTREQLLLLKTLCIQTFSETYEHLNTPENFRLYIQTHFNEDTLKCELDDKNSFTYFVSSGNDLAGYLKLNINDAQTEKMPAPAIEIERIYILKKYHGKGAGKQLLNYAISKGRELQKQFIWLGVWNQNKNAIEFYERNSFEQFGTHIFKLGNDEQEDYLYRHSF